MKKKGILVSGLAVLVVLVVFGIYWFFLKPEPEPVEEAIQTTKVRTGDITISVSGVGSVLPEESISIGFQQGGVITQVEVKLGDSVTKGQILAELDASDAKMKVLQAELDLYSYFSADAINQAEITRLNSILNLEDTIDELEYLISPQVFYWEQKLEKAETALKELETSSNASDADLDKAKLDVSKAKQFLAGARNDYYGTYVWEVFPYSYTDETTLETVDSYLEPTDDQVSLARTKVRSAELAVVDAEAYLQTLQLGVEAFLESESVPSGANMAKLEQARVALLSARADLDRTVLRAPIDGTITSVSAGVGQAVGTSPILTIETTDRMMLRFYLEETDIGFVKPGNPVVVSFDAYPDQTMEGMVAYIEPSLETVDGNPAAVIWATLPADLKFPLMKGMSADVEVISGSSKNTLLVPVQALREIAPGSFAVFTVQPDNSLEMKVVTVGLKDYANAEILSGVKTGDIVSTGSVETK